MVVSFNDLKQLHHYITQQMEHYDLVSGPTITVNIKQANSNSIQYSSWERFLTLQAIGSEITSEVIIKYEFILRLPNTPALQRCIINIAIDSGLPIVADPNRDSNTSSFLDLVFFSPAYNTVDISIDL